MPRRSPARSCRPRAPVRSCRAGGKSLRPRTTASAPIHCPIPQADSSNEDATHLPLGCNPFDDLRPWFRACRCGRLAFVAMCTAVHKGQWSARPTRRDLMRSVGQHSRVVIAVTGYRIGARREVTAPATLVALESLRPPQRRTATSRAHAAFLRSLQDGDGGVGQRHRAISTLHGVWVESDAARPLDALREDRS